MSVYSQKCKYVHQTPKMTSNDDSYYLGIAAPTLVSHGNHFIQVRSQNLQRKVISSSHIVRLAYFFRAIPFSSFLYTECIKGVHWLTVFEYKFTASIYFAFVWFLLSILSWLGFTNSRQLIILEIHNLENLANIKKSRKYTSRNNC